LKIVLALLQIAFLLEKFVYLLLTFKNHLPLSLIDIQSFVLGRIGLHLIFLDCLLFLQLFNLAELFLKLFLNVL
jgi:hypothetical protein